jgi:hypothetical protein
MSAISIVINAVNNAKAAFTSVGNQVVDLNKKLNKAAGVMRSLFAVGIVAKFVKDLVGASSETEKLEGIVSRIKDKFGDAATTIGDGIVAILGAIEPVILKVGDFLNFLIDGIKRVAATATALLMGEGFKDAVNIADEVLATEKAERAARIEAKKTAEEKKKLDKQVADNSIKEAERVAKEKEKLAQEIAKLEKDIAEQQNKMAEAQMTDAEILAKRKEESEKAYNDYVTALLEGRTKDQLEAFNEYLKLQEEILKIESEISDAAAKVAQQKEKAAKNSAIEAEAEKRRLQQKSAEQTALEKINALETQRRGLIEKQAQLIAKSDDLRRRAIDKNYNEEQKQAERSKQKEERRFSNLVASARAKVKAGFGGRLSESERLAFESDQAKKAAAEAEAQAKQLEDAARQAQIDSEMHLANIEKDIKDLLAMKE